MNYVQIVITEAYSLFKFAQKSFAYILKEVN